MLLFGSIFKLPLAGGWLNRFRVWLCLARSSQRCFRPLATRPFFYPMIWSLAAAGMIVIVTSLIVAWRQVEFRSSFGIPVSGLVTLATCRRNHLRSRPTQQAKSFVECQSGATLGALAMAVTLARHFIEERLKRRRAQNAEVDALKRLANTYGSMPIGCSEWNNPATSGV